MRTSIYLISIPDLILSLIPLLVLCVVFWKWSLKVSTTLYATARMVLQLLLIGFVLTFIFKNENIGIVFAVLTVMLVVAGWIALRPIQLHQKQYYFKALISLAIVSLLVLSLVVFAIIRPVPWYLPTYVIPLAGMIIANSMNTLSLAAERFIRERESGKSYKEARGIALQASLIPLTNNFFAVGLVALPGMMTGQILAGVDPLIATRYQILIMASVFGAGGLSAAGFLWQLRRATFSAKS